MASVTLSNVSKSIGGKKILDDFSMTIEDSEFVVLIGPSGSGKSTLLRLLAGLDRVDEGEIRVDGKIINHLSPSQREIAMVFQSYALYPHMTAEENISFCLKNAGIAKATVKRRVAEVGALLEIEELLERTPDRLSGGQRQRVAIARALVRNPKLFLFDEPLSNLDTALRTQTRLELARLHSKSRTTTLYITHDQVEAMTLGERIAVIDQGKLQQFGPPLELYERPANTFVAGFLGSPKMNLIEAEVTALGIGVTGISSGGYELRLPLDSPSVSVGTKLTLGVRPEHFHISESPDSLRAEIEVIERLGNRTLLHCKPLDITFGKPLSARTLPDGSRSAETVTVEVPPETSLKLKKGEKLGLSPSIQHIHLFSPNGEAL